MKNKYLMAIVLLAFLLLIITFFYFSKKDIETKQTISNLYYEDVMGSDNKIKDSQNVINVNSQIRFLPNGNLLVLDTQKSTIKEFDIDYKFVKDISKNGQGPGEIILPKNFNVGNNGEIVISDLTNGLVIFDSKQKPLRSIKFNKVYNFLNAIFSSNNTIYVNNPMNETLIEEYSMEGKLIRSFGDIFKVNRIEAKTLINAAYMTIDDAGSLWVCFKYKPIVRKYSKQGILLLEKDLNTPFIKTQLKREKKIPSSGGFAVQLYVNDICYLKNKLYLSAHRYLIEIDSKTLVTNIFDSKVPDSKRIYFIDKLSYCKKINKFLFISGYTGVINKITNLK